MSQHDAVDPLTVLRADDLPVQPDPAFAARLRTRLEAALSLPTNTGGVEMSGTAEAIAEMTEVPAASPRPAALPYLTVADARAAIAWYADAFGAALVGEPIVMPDGRIGHAEIAITGGMLYLADEYPELGLKAPAPQTTSVSLMLDVADTDTALERSRRHGAVVQREIYESYGTRNATIVDPFGHRWMLSGPVTGAVSRIQHGDIGYVSVWTPDADRAAAFYGHVLGWVYDPATQFDFGTVLDGTDPLGMPLAVYQPSDVRPRPLLNGAGHGELSYITYEVSDSEAFRQFYQRVLHWSFEPGRVADGWQISGTHPMAGVAGGGSEPTTVPMWTVSDIDAAVRRVREAGGTVIAEPSRQPYGLMAECHDDQGTRFYLGSF